MEARKCIKKALEFVWKWLWMYFGVCYFPVFLSVKLMEWILRVLIAVCYLLTFEPENAHIFINGLFKRRNDDGRRTE